MKYILVIGDGMADNPVDSLGGKTPLDYASIPTIDALASRGTLGSVLTVPRGLPAGSDTAILSIFGYDPNVYYTGRAPIEAAASGIRLSPGDAAYRCNMITCEDGDLPFEQRKLLSHSAGSIEGDESDALIHALFADPEFKVMADAAGLIVHASSSFRHIAVQKKADIQGLVLAPPHDHLGEAVGPLLPTGCENAGVLEALMRKAHTVLDHHPINEKRRADGKMPANGVWFWAEGTAVALTPFAEKYGKTGAVVSAVPLCHGIAALAGLDIVTVPGATGELDTNFEGKVDAAVSSLETHDFVAVHIEAPDECTHNGDLDGKLQAIEWLDSRAMKPLTEKLASSGTAYRLLLLSDHKTLTSTRGHDGDPVPFVLYDSAEDNATGLRYTESQAQSGVYVDPGTKLMDMLFER